MTIPVALPLRGNVLYIQNGDLATIRTQCADITGVSSIASYIGGSIGLHITSDHVNVAQRIREATGTTLPSPQARTEALSTPREGLDVKVQQREKQTFSGAANAIPAITLRQLPPANRCLPAPKAKALRMPLVTPDVIYLGAPELVGIVGYCQRLVSESATFGRLLNGLRGANVDDQALVGGLVFSVVTGSKLRAGDVIFHDEQPAYRLHVRNKDRDDTVAGETYAAWMCGYIDTEHPERLTGLNVVYFAPNRKCLVYNPDRPFRSVGDEPDADMPTQLTLEVAA